MLIFKVVQVFLCVLVIFLTWRSWTKDCELWEFVCHIIVFITFYVYTIAARKYGLIQKEGNPMEYFWNGWKFNPECCLAYDISKALGMPIERYNSSIEVRDEKTTSQRKHRP